MLQQQPVPHASSGICQLCHGSSTGNFLSQSGAYHQFAYMCLCLIWQWFCFQVLCWMVYSPTGVQPLGFVPLQPFRAFPWQHMCILVIVIDQCQECSEWLLPPLLWVGGTLSYWVSCPSAVPTIWWAYSFGDLTESHLIPSPLLHGREGSSFPGLVPPNNTVDSESVVAIQSADSGVVIGYQVDKFACSWSAKWFGAHWHIYPGFMGKILYPAHFP